MALEGVCFLFVDPTYLLIRTVLQLLYTDKNALQVTYLALVKYP